MKDTSDGGGDRDSKTEAWLPALKARDPDALESLVESHGDAIFEFILYRVGRARHAAEDLTQETLLAAIRGITDFEGRSELRTWLFGIANNKVVEWRRNASRMRPLGEILVDADDEIFSTLGRIAEEPIPDEVLETKEAQAMVGATLASLPEAYRVALQERYVHERSVPETARRQGRGVKAAESTLFRAKRAFAEVFELLGKRALGDHQGDPVHGPGAANEPKEARP